MAFSLLFLFFYNSQKCAAWTCIIYHSELFRLEGGEIVARISLPRAYLLQKVWSTWLTRFLREKGQAHRHLGQEHLQADPSLQPSPQRLLCHTCKSYLPSLCGSPALAAASVGTMAQAGCAMPPSHRWTGQTLTGALWPWGSYSTCLGLAPYSHKNKSFFIGLCEE